MGNLQPAHHGYRYQDIITAYMLTRGISERYQHLTVDRKHVADDKLDDLEIVAAGRCVRRQFKSSQNVSRQLQLSDFTDEKSTLRLDLLLRTYVRAADRAADEYRLCVTWQAPGQQDELMPYLVPVVAGEVAPTIKSWPATLFRFRAEVIWPAGQELAWDGLRQYAAAEPAFSRDNLLAFCERFIIEVALPRASKELRAPGPLEQALIQELTGQVGIGRYPNHGREPADVAALAIAVATLARTESATLTPAVVERDLNIRTDFGRVAQAFPLDESLFHDRPTIRRQLQTAALAGKPQLLTAAPGSGKSWELTRLAEELTGAGAIVARHYCYLEPGDAVVEQRITTNVFFANLLAELKEAAPDVFASEPVRYAADIKELEQALDQAARSGRPVVLIIDGLDHIARVRGESYQLAASETDIVERLATLVLPSGATVLVGSQPGQHLQPLRERWGSALRERQLPVWLPSDVQALAKRYGLPAALRTAGLLNAGQQAPVLALLATRSEGNPLYARYLIRGLLAELRAGTLFNPLDWLTDAPVIAGDVAHYYAYLYAKASRDAKSIADVLGVIDFGVTPAELTDILPEMLADWVPDALRSLEPVLSTVTGQGGIRIFHESFRRFMTATLAAQNRKLSAVLRPVIQWLELRGLFLDAKSYRFLLPALRRAGQDEAVLAHVDAHFVSQSIAHAHPVEAIQRNLALAGDVAALHQNWPALARCIELHRAAVNCFDEAEGIWPSYWQTYLQLFGPASAAARLLFDGRPTQLPATGILACALIDEAGGTAPWQEYLPQAQTLLESATLESAELRSEKLAVAEQWQLAVIRGQYRLEPNPQALRQLRNRLARQADRLRPCFVRSLAALVAQVATPQQVLRWAKHQRNQRPVFVSRVATLLRLGAADELARRGEIQAAAASAELALAGADTPVLAAACLAHGARADVTQASELAALDIAVGANHHLHDATSLRTWVASVRLLAHAPAGSQVLTRERQRVAGSGWYRCWLRFVLTLAEADAQPQQLRGPGVVLAFQELTRVLSPFEGQPRVPDIWAAYEVLHETIAWGLSRLRTRAEWEAVLLVLSTITRDLAFGLDREESGPLSTEALGQLLEPYASHHEYGSQVRICIEQEIRYRDTRGTYYGDHAQHALRLARVQLAGHDKEAANAAWQQAGIYFSAYGFRKDITVFDLLESIPMLGAVNQSAALIALEQVQPLTDAVLRHTDGRETKHAPGEWYRALAAVHAPAALAVLARTLMREAGADSWPTQIALREAVGGLKTTADPHLLDDVLATLRSDSTYDDRSAVEVELRLCILERITAQDAEAGRIARNRAEAEFYNEGRKLEPAARRLLAAAGSVNNSSAPMGAPMATERTVRPKRTLRERSKRRKAAVLFAAGATPTGLIAGMREAVRTLPDEAGAWQVAVDALAEQLVGLLDSGQFDAVRQLLRFFKRDAGIAYLRACPLQLLAARLAELGHTLAAALAYALAYTLARGGGGFLVMGDQQQSFLLARALELNQDLAQQTVADEVAYLLRGDWGTFGASRHLIERLAGWGNASQAFATWQAAAQVVAHRLPSNSSLARFEPFEAASLPTDSVEEGLLALLLARLAEPRLELKIQALAGIARAVRRIPILLVNPLKDWLTRDTHVTSVCLVLDILVQLEKAPYPLTHALAPELYGYAQSQLWGPREAARQLLGRAGLPAPPSPTFMQQYPLADWTADLRWLLLADPAGMMAAVAPLWPALPDTLAGRLKHLLLDNEAHQERHKDRIKLRYDDRHRRPTFLPVLGWDTELLVGMLNVQLPGPVPAGAQTRRLLTAVQPDAALYTAAATCRIPRPDWPLPVTVQPGVGPLLRQSTADPAYADWVRLATVEYQYRYDNEDFDNPPTEELILFAGAIVAPPSTIVLVDAIPFREAAAQEWWAAASTISPYVQLVGWAPQTSWLGTLPLLVPPSALRLLGLKPSATTKSLAWMDAAGRASLVYRTWSVREPKMAYQKALTSRGSDLLVHPTIFARLQAYCQWPIRELNYLTLTPLK